MVHEGSNVISKANFCTNTCAHCKELTHRIVKLVQEHQKFLESCVDQIDLIKVVLQNMEARDKARTIADELSAKNAVIKKKNAS